MLPIRPEARERLAVFLPSSYREEDLNRIFKGTSGPNTSKDQALYVLATLEGLGHVTQGMKSQQWLHMYSNIVGACHLVEQHPL
jgi:hypothetical protein